jgi:ankyrin repeat protein
MEPENISKKLVEAIVSWNIDELTRLLADTKEPGIYDTDGKPLLHIAALFQSDGAIKAMLDNGFSPDVEWDDTTALTISCGEGNARCAKILIDRGANVNCQNSEGFSFFAAEQIQT